MSDTHYYLGSDVGTGSARAGIYSSSGVMMGTATRDIQMWKPAPDYVEQSSEDIWQAVCQATKEALGQSGLAPADIKGIGFDATCSLVALDKSDQPVSISPDGNDNQNVIVWMDHRAMDQTARINELGHDVLKYVGGTISPEMETPKLLWLKENMPDCWSRTKHFFDLPDYLTYRATGDAVRSLCSTVCKWTYLGHEDGDNPDSVGKWDTSFFESIGLGDLVDEGFSRIGTRVRPMGEPIGSGLTEAAASDLGLAPGTPVGVSIIDAHAGGVGMLGALLDDEESVDFSTRLALIGGTSSCHMAVSPDAIPLSGVWGPYYSAMVPGFWLNEGGQSATGSLIDHVIFSHAASTELQVLADAANKTVYEILNDRLDELSEDVTFPAALTQDLHVLPYFHGNRSPRADATLRGMVSGLSLSADLDTLALLYLATIQAIAHGTRHIIDTMNEGGYNINTILACGGGTKNPVFLREHADITGCRIVLPKEPEAVLLGSAILGGVASGDFESIPDAMAAMSGVGEEILPSGGEAYEFHDKKHQVFHQMHQDHLKYRELLG